METEESPDERTLRSAERPSEVRDGQSNSLEGSEGANGVDKETDRVLVLGGKVPIVSGLRNTSCKTAELPVWDCGAVCALGLVFRTVGDPVLPWQHYVWLCAAGTVCGQEGSVAGGVWPWRTPRRGRSPASMGDQSAERLLPLSRKTPAK